MHVERNVRQDDVEKERIIEALRRYVGTVKSEALRYKRNEGDYPVTLAAAAAYLAGEFGVTLSGSPGDTGVTHSKPHSYLTKLLESGKWDQSRVCRKRCPEKDGHTYKFFLPGDDYFTELPLTEKAYLKVLFSLERKRLRFPSETEPSRDRKLAPDRRSFEAALRDLYKRLIRNTRGATYVRIPELRKTMSLSPEVFDSGILRMRDEGKLILSRHGYAASLSPHDLDGCIEVSPGDYYYYLEFRDL